jgi:ribonuclease HI
MGLLYLSLLKLAKHNRIQLAWVPGHRGTDRKEMADEIARRSSSHLVIGTETALGISVKVAR